MYTARSLPFVLNVLHVRAGLLCVVQLILCVVQLILCVVQLLMGGMQGVLQLHHLGRQSLSSISV